MTVTAAGGRRRRPRKGDLRQEAILETAARLLSERSFSSVSVDDLAQGAGISRSAFYFYFDSRDAVLRTLADRVSEWVHGASEAWLRRTDESPVEALRRAIRANLDVWREHGPVLRAVVDARGHDAVLSEFWTTHAEHVVASFAEQIERERAAGVALPGPPSAAELARLLLLMAERANYDASRLPASRARDDRLVEGLTAIWVRAIYGAAA